MRAYHFLRADLRSGRGDEPAWTVGECRHWVGPVTLKSGYLSSPDWLSALGYGAGPIACIVEIPEPLPQHRIRITGKQVTPWRQLVAARNVERELRMFACECTERALLQEREAGREPDPRSWQAIAVSRRYADGQATDEQLATAAAAAHAAWAAGAAANEDARAGRTTGVSEVAWQRRRLADLLDPLFESQEVPI